MLLVSFLRILMVANPWLSAVHSLAFSLVQWKADMNIQCGCSKGWWWWWWFAVLLFDRGRQVPSIATRNIGAGEWTPSAEAWCSIFARTNSKNFWQNLRLDGKLFNAWVHQSLGLLEAACFYPCNEVGISQVFQGATLADIKLSGAHSGMILLFTPAGDFLHLQRVIAFVGQEGASEDEDQDSRSGCK